MGKNNFLDWDLKLNSSRTDSIMKTINWNNEILKTLKNKLDGANCIQIKMVNQLKLDLREVGWECTFLIFLKIL
ncbi:hypothetical protein LEQ05_11740 [Riemerella anatipestifer]|nr:hypothetical protein LEQ05_11740 [Riemerella anatipestifer]